MSAATILDGEDVGRILTDTDLRICNKGSVPAAPVVALEMMPSVPLFGRHLDDVDLPVPNGKANAPCGGERANEMNKPPAYPIPDQTWRLADGKLARAATSNWHNVRLRSSHGVVIALDMDSLDRMQRVVGQTTELDGVVGYKVGLTATLRLGLKAAVKLLRAVSELPLIYDHQKAGPDVPDMAPKFAATCREAGVDGLILFPIAGPRAVAAFSGNAYANRLLPIVGGDLPFPDYNASGGGYVIDDALDKIFRKAIESGVDHFVVPGNTAVKIAHHARWLVEKIERPVLFVPGIGALGGAIADAFAAAPGCDLYAVVGRAIYDAAEPAEAARRLAGEALRFA